MLALPLPLLLSFFLPGVFAECTRSLLTDTAKRLVSKGSVSLFIEQYIQLILLLFGDMFFWSKFPLSFQLLRRVIVASVVRGTPAPKVGLIGRFSVRAMDLEMGALVVPVYRPRPVSARELAHELLCVPADIEVLT